MSRYVESTLTSEEREQEGDLLECSMCCAIYAEPDSRLNSRDVLARSLRSFDLPLNSGLWPRGRGGKRGDVTQWLGAEANAERVFR